MSLPGSVRAEVTSAIRRSGSDGDSIVAVTPVGGGCINHGARVDTEAGRSYFLKWNPSAPSGMFAAEENGLRALRTAADGVDAECRPRVPLPLARSVEEGSPGGFGWLLTEWLQPGGATADADRKLGRGLALLHAAPPFDPASQAERTPSEAHHGSVIGADQGGFGWGRDNWIGSLAQSNTPSTSWSTFWRERRIAPQLDLARGNGCLVDALMDDLLDAIPHALDGVQAPSLIHGDLWSGNSYATDDGRAALVDPAVYFGDGEVDLAMTELFGGFGASFYDAYDAVRPVTAEYRSHRRALYQLYYLLVHVNLFGRSYEAGCRRAAETVLGSLG